jgi:hypothetical protein
LYLFGHIYNTETKLNGMVYSKYIILNFSTNEIYLNHNETVVPETELNGKKN